MDKRPHIEKIEEQLSAAELDAGKLIADLSEEAGGWRAMATSWSVAECLDHLAITNRVYLQPMQLAASTAKERGTMSGGSANPGLLG